MEVDQSNKITQNLTNLPPEILHHILQWLQPADLIVTLPRVCRSLNAFTKGNRNLYRANYLHNLDTPRNLDLDWERELHDLVKLEAICDRVEVSDKERELEFVHDTVNRLLQNASPADDLDTYSATHHPSRNASLLRELFEQESTQEAFMQRSVLFLRIRGTLACCQSERRHKMSAKLHCLFSQAILNMGRTRSRRTYPVACSIVYDLRRYTQRTRWGPFMDDGTDNVDWEKVEAILIVLGHNISSKRLVSRVFSDVWENPFAGSWPGSYISAPPPPPKPAAATTTAANDDNSDDEIDPDLEAQDPYGVTGTWSQIVCFLDYNDFFSYNFPTGRLAHDLEPRPPLDVSEATRLIMLKVHVTSIEPPGPQDGQALPVVHFQGVSRSLDDSWDDNANSDIRGTVRLTREGEVRWTTFSIFHGQERWRSEGIQIGGVKSARGVVGNWFDRDYDAHGPAGPTAFWKAPSTPHDSNITLYDALPNDFFVAYGNLVGDGDSDSDPEAEMPYALDEFDEVEDEDEDDLEPVDEELPGLLRDALLELEDPYLPM